MVDVKSIIRSRREELGLTMKEVADKVGVSEGTISRWESGDIQNMKRDKIASLAKALDMSPAVIMGWEEPSPSKNTQMLADKDMITIYHIKQSMAPDAFQNIMEFIKKMYKLEHPEDDFID